MICLYAQQIKERIKMNTTKASRRPIGLGETIDAEIEAIARSIELHRHALRDQGVWLFWQSWAAGGAARLSKACRAPGCAGAVQYKLLTAVPA